MRVVYFDCFSGASGDMLLGALFDAGASVDRVHAALDSLELKGWELTLEETTRAGIRAAKARVAVKEERSHRSLREILGIIDRARIEPRPAEWAHRAFTLLAEAEARVHAADIEKVAFHEVGALDAIIDIVGSSVALDDLAPDRIYGSALTLGSGTTASEHGRLPIPPPAVAEIVTGLPVHFDGEGELVTPTGAALLRTFVDEFGPPPAFTVRTVGYGAGDTETSVPNVLRVLVGDAIDVHAASDAVLIETNIDDLSPEVVGYVTELLFAAGAQDVWTTPIVMKKSRSALQLSVLVAPPERERVLDVIFTETTALGVRVSSVTKVALDREWIETDVLGQSVRVKIGMRGGSVVTVSPEFEDAAKAARATGLALKEVYARAGEAARARLADRLTS